MHIYEILATKGSEVYRVTPEASVFDAISAMAARNVGALLVMDGETLAGVISERDYRNKVILKGRTSKETAVKEIMSTEIVWVTPEESVEKALATMSQGKIRHLPVMNEGHQVLGIVSIGDLVKAILDERETEIIELKKYIYGSYPG